MTVYIWLVTASFGIVAWAFHLESKVDQEAVQREALKELILSKLEGIDGRLERIERRQIRNGYGLEG